MSQDLPAHTQPGQTRRGEKLADILRRKSRQILALVVAVAVIGPALLLTQYYFAQRVSNVYTPVVDTSSRLVISLRWAQSDLRLDRAYGLTESRERLSSRESEVDSAIRRLERAAGDDPAFAPALADLVRANEQWWEYAYTVVGTPLEPDSAGPLGEEAALVASEVFNQAVASANALNEAADDKRELMRTLRTIILVGGSAMAIGAILVAALMVIRDTRRTAGLIADPIEDLDRVARNETHGGRGDRASEACGPAEVRDLATAFNALLDTRDAYERDQADYVRQLQELDRHKDDFVSTVSHELRTPLASIIGYTEMLCDGDAGDLTDPQLRLVSVVQRNAERLKGLIEDLLVLSRIESGGLDGEHVPTLLHEVVESVIESLAPVADRAGVSLNGELSPARVSGEPNQLERAVTNLVSNAVKFTPEGGSVEVTLSVTGGVATLSIADTGIGIPADEQVNLGTRFYRASTAQRQSIPGTGLGLSIVRAIAEAHEGTVDFDSEEGRGTTFRLTVPVLRG